MNSAAHACPAAMILVVEDDRLLREMAVEVLSDEGWQAIGVAGAAEGLDRLATAGDVALLITDINMPGMDGLGLLSRARERYPALKMMVFSGQPHMSAGSLPCGTGFLRKPFTVAQFVARVRQLIDAPPGTPASSER